jgi:hypothetical protein
MVWPFFIQWRNVAAGGRFAREGTKFSTGFGDKLGGAKPPFHKPAFFG